MLCASSFAWRIVALQTAAHARQPELLDAVLGERGRGVPGERRRELALEDVLAAVHQHDPDFPGRDRAVGARGRTQKIVERRSHLRPRKVPASDHEREHRATQLGVSHDRALLEHVDHVVADTHGVGERFESQRVLGKAGDAPEVGDVTEGEYEVVELELMRTGG
jgi:hypothetical protein